MTDRLTWWLSTITGRHTEAMQMKRRQRSIVVWAVFAASLGWLAFVGWQALLGAAAVALGIGVMQGLLRWEKRGKN